MAKGRAYDENMMTGQSEGDPEIGSHGGLSLAGLGARYEKRVCPFHRRRGEQIGAKDPERFCRRRVRVIPERERGLLPVAVTASALRDECQYRSREPVFQLCCAPRTVGDPLEKERDDGADRGPQEHTDSHVQDV